MTAIAVTGHRPDKLWGYDMADARYARVAGALADAMRACGADTLITGMALGFDQLAAEVAEGLDGVRCVAAVPFAGQEARWPWASRRRWSRLLDAADEVHVVSDGGYAPHKMQVRNEWMVDHADVVAALWDGTRGGTANCVRYAIGQGKPILRLDPRLVTAEGCPGFRPHNQAARDLLGDGWRDA